MNHIATSPILRGFLQQLDGNPLGKTKFSGNSGTGFTGRFRSSVFYGVVGIIILESTIEKHDVNAGTGP